MDSSPPDDPEVPRFITSPATRPSTRGEVSTPGSLYGGRYRTEGVLGAGGFGTVWRALDEELKCPAVVKVIHLDSEDDKAFGQALLDSRPIEMVLRHPNIAPIRARGPTNGGMWLAMDLIEGGTFLDLIADLYPHRNIGRTSTAAIDAAPPRPLRVALDSGGQSTDASQLAATTEVIQLLVQASRGIGAAHSLAIVHRDLKPDNLMYEVRPSLDGGEQRVALVIDWGLALWTDPNAPPAQPEPPGAVIGVPEYLAPERLARHDDGSPRSDVYSLGAILFHILTGDPPPPGGLPPDITPESVPGAMHEWFEVCRMAMASDPNERFGDGAVFAESLAAATEEVRLRVNDAERTLARQLRDEARALDAEAKAALAPLHPWNDPMLRVRWWAIEDKARQRALDAARAEARWLAGVEASLRRMPDLPAGHLALAEHHADGLHAAEDDNRALDAQVHQDRLAALCHDIRRARTTCRERGVVLRPVVLTQIDTALARYTALLEGTGRLSLLTDPPGIRVEYADIVEQERRWRPQTWRLLGVTPLVAVAIPHGPGVLRLHLPDERTVTHSIRLRRGEHWDGIAPGDISATPITLPPRFRLGGDAAYVPAGWALIGGDRGAVDPIERRRVWIDGFLMACNPVTIAGYALFIEALVAEGRQDEARRRLPRFREDAAGDTGEPIGSRGITLDQGRVFVDEAMADLPVCFIDWWDACAYAAWIARLTGEPWRLPTEWEYEKAARGADGRRLPWGDHMEERWTCVINSAYSTAPLPVQTQALDVSVYGIRWLVGNRMTWCLDSYSTEGPPADGRASVPVADDDPDALRVARGSAYCVPSRITSTSSRFADPSHSRTNALGIRLVRSIG